LDDYRCQRIAHGAGVDVDEVSGFTNQFYRFKKMMRGIGGP
jgi:signal recognition particle GTPase